MTDMTVSDYEFVLTNGGKLTHQKQDSAKYKHELVSQPISCVITIVPRIKMQNIIKSSVLLDSIKISFFLSYRRREGDWY